MFVMGDNQLPPQLKKFRWLVYISPVITILSLTLLLWTYRSNQAFQVWTQYPQATSGPQIPVQSAEPTKHSAGQIVTHAVPFMAVKGTKTLLVSAYLEHRTGKREVRVIAVVLRSETVAYYCVLHCQKQLHISEGVCQIHADHFGFAYGTADIMCPLPTSCETPSHIAVTSAPFNSEGNEGFCTLFLTMLEAVH